MNLTARIRSLKVCVTCLAILCTLAYVQHQDAKDDQAARVAVK